MVRPIFLDVDPDISVLFYLYYMTYPQLIPHHIKSSVIAQHRSFAALKQCAVNYFPDHFQGTSDCNKLMVSVQVRNTCQIHLTNQALQIVFKSGSFSRYISLQQSYGLQCFGLVSRYLLLATNMWRIIQIHLPETKKLI